jgi:hypothetical protein
VLPGWRPYVPGRHAGPTSSILSQRGYFALHGFHHIHDLKMARTNGVPSTIIILYNDTIIKLKLPFMIMEFASGSEIVN